MAATVTAPSEGICDDDIVRYWAIFADSDTEAAWATAGTPGVSQALAQRCVEQLDAYDEGLRNDAEERMLSHATIDEATFLAAVHGSEGSHAAKLVGRELVLRRAALVNAHHGDAVARFVPELGELDRWTALDNTGVDGATLAAIAAERNYPAATAENLAAPTWLLAKVLAGAGDPDALESVGGSAQLRRSTVLAHPNAERCWVIDALDDTDARVRFAAARWPGFTASELRAYANGSARPGVGTGVAQVAAAMLQERHTPPAERVVARTGRYALIAELAVWLRQLDDDTVAAASRIARSGFNGTVGELADIAATCSP